MTQSRATLEVSSMRQENSWTWLGLLLVLMLLIGLYDVSRFSGRWSETDSSAFTNLIRDFSKEGRLVPTQDSYPNGYAFQSISTFILALTGLDVVTLQQRVYPIIAWLIVLPAWLLYRELAGSARSATLAVTLLFIQPEFLFVVLRSSHEKFSRIFMLLCLFLLLHSFKVLKRPWAFTIHVVLFYLAAFALISTNNLLGHSFIFSIASTLVLGWILEKRKTITWSNDSFRRLFYASLICMGLVYLFTFYIYQPAGHDLLVLKDTKERIFSMFLDVQSRSNSAVLTNPYAYISFGWINLPAYFAVSIADWMILGISFVIWLNQGLRWLWRGEAPKTRAAWLLWLLYAAFAVQGGFSIVADVSGSLGSNLQQRIFPSFSIIAVAMIASQLDHWHPRRFGKPISLALAFAIFSVAILSVFKATNEPLLSNKWTFYRQGEMTALEWTDRHLTHSHIGTEIDERLRSAFFTVEGESVNNNSFDDFTTSTMIRNLLITQVTRLRSSRMQQPIPVPPDALRVYDDGEAELYRLRPKTPYQQ